MNKFIKFGIACALLCIIFVSLGCSKGAKEIRIGAIFPMTGGSATFGKSSKEGMEIAVEEFNEKGGINIGGKNFLIKPIYDDSAGQPEQAANAARKQIDQNKVIAIVGEVMSKNSLAIAPICQSKGIVMVSSASTNPEVTKKGDYIFRVCFLDSFQGVVGARYAYNTLKVKKAAILYDNANDYNKGLASFFSDEFKRLGGRIVADEAFTDEEKTVDFKAQLTTIKSAKPDFLYLPNYYAASALIMKQAKEIGLNVPTGGGDGWDSPQLVKIGGQSVEGGFFSNHFSKDDPRPEVQNFVKKYIAKYGAEPDALASLAYDAAFVLLSAIEKAGSIKGENIRDTLKSIQINGVTGKISFDQDRNPIKSAVILQIKNGKQQYVTTVNP
ncbi:TPA: ABC transporter substrate-binding protein [Candidatus Poribacteria bacterium]|nr:ABC transporter substrate-binding protein [Candidatus Poribacteria bacterium]